MEKAPSLREKRVETNERDVNNLFPFPLFLFLSLSIFHDPNECFACVQNDIVNADRM